METTLLVMAAGMGSRFGGLKQIAPFGPNGEILLDFSIYDAVKAGFNKAVFVIKKEIEQDFREAIGKRIEKMIDVSYVFQDMHNLPDGFSVPEDRKKPWGTGHAVLSCRDEIKTPFVAINADDYYGKEAFVKIHDYLVEKGDTCMVGFQLGKTLTENGTVCRGVCQTDKGYLNAITECTDIDKNSGFPLDTTVSMNMWGFSPDIFDYLEKRFIRFLKETSNPSKDEFYIPTMVDSLIKEEQAKVKVLTTSEQWYGVTYKEDSETVRLAIQKMISEGKYSEL